MTLFESSNVQIMVAPVALVILAVVLAGLTV
jgi:hypothetical protein